MRLYRSGAPTIGHAGPDTYPPPPLDPADCPGPAPRVRPTRSASSKPVSYVEKPQVDAFEKGLKAAARLFICDPGTRSVPDACKKCGVGEAEAVHRRVHRINKTMEATGAAGVLERPNVRARVLEPVAAVPAAARWASRRPAPGAACA